MDAALEQKLISSIDYWSWKVTKNCKVLVWQHQQTVRGQRESEGLVEQHNLFYPTKGELVGLVWEKVLQPQVLTRFEDIWTRPGASPFEIGKFISKVVRRTFLDYHRKQTVRKKERLALSLSLPLADNHGSDGDKAVSSIETLADTIPAEATADLRLEELAEAVSPVLSDSERLVFTEHDLNGETIRSVAQKQNLSKSTAQRILASARKKAFRTIEDWREIHNHVLIDGCGRKRHVHLLGSSPSAWMREASALERETEEPTEVSSSVQAPSEATAGIFVAENQSESVPLESFNIACTQKEPPLAQPSCAKAAIVEGGIAKLS